jgi:hypothetical protein
MFSLDANTEKSDKNCQLMREKGNLLSTYILGIFCAIPCAFIKLKKSKKQRTILKPSDVLHLSSVQTQVALSANHS